MTVCAGEHRKINSLSLLSFRNFLVFIFKMNLVDWFVVTFSFPLTNSSTERGVSASPSLLILSSVLQISFVCFFLFSLNIIFLFLSHNFRFALPIFSIFVFVCFKVN